MLDTIFPLNVEERHMLHRLISLGALLAAGEGNS